jgi:hypothetical protein
VIIKIISRIGEPPIVLPASQFIVCQDNGTPIAAGGAYGPQGTDLISCVTCDDFDRVLHLLGVRTTVIVERLRTGEPPQGARLLAGPSSR